MDTNHPLERVRLGRTFDLILQGRVAVMRAPVLGFEESIQVMVELTEGGHDIGSIRLPFSEGLELGAEFDVRMILGPSSSRPKMSPSSI